MRKNYEAPPCVIFLTPQLLSVSQCKLSHVHLVLKHRADRLQVVIQKNIMNILIYAISRYIFQLITSKLRHLHEHCSLWIFIEKNSTVMVRCSRSGSNTYVSRTCTFLLSQLKHRTSFFMAAVRVGSAHSNAASGAPEYRRPFHFRSKTVRRIERRDTIDKCKSAPCWHLHDLYQLHANATVHISFVVKSWTFLINRHCFIQNWRHTTTYLTFNLTCIGPCIANIFAEYNQ